MTSLAASHSPQSLAADDPAGRIAELFDAHCDFVCRVLRRLGVHEAALDDAVQEVFITAHRRWSSFEGRSSARSWLYGIARRIAFRQRRSADARARRFVPADDERPEGIEEPFARAHAAHSLAALLRGLDADKRAVFVLMEIEGMTAPEVAEALEIPLGTAYSRLRAAWQGLGREADRERLRLRRVLPSLATPSPSPEQRRRMWGLVAGGLAIPTQATSGSTVSTGWLAQAKWIGVGAALGVGLLGARAAMVVSTREHVIAPAPSEPSVAARVDAGGAPRSVVELEPAPVLAPPPAPASRPTPTLVPRPTAQPRARATPPPEPTDGLAAELALLQRAQQALREDRPAAALTELDEHARRFPAGQLSDERRAARITALCAAGRPEQAAAEARALGRVDTACP